MATDQETSARQNGMRHGEGCRVQAKDLSSLVSFLLF
jgi:hypothetical protein